MLIGSKIQLRTVRAGELDELYRHETNLSTRGAYYPWDLESEPAFRKSFEDGGWWGEEYGWLLIVEPNDTIVGYIGFFHTRKGEHWTSYELYYTLVRARPCGSGLRHRSRPTPHRPSVRFQADNPYPVAYPSRQPRVPTDR